MEWVYILGNRVERRIEYFFWQIIFRAILLLTILLITQIIFRFFSIRLKIEFLYFTWESIRNWCIYPKQSRKGHCIFLLTDYFQRKFAFYLGVPILYLHFFDSHKIEISVFYVIEHIELVYILQNRVENDIVYFFWQIIFRAILLLRFWCLDNI